MYILLTISLIIGIILMLIPRYFIYKRLQIYKKALEDWNNYLNFKYSSPYNGFCLYFYERNIEYDDLIELLEQREVFGHAFHYYPIGSCKIGNLKRIEALEKAIKLSKKKIKNIWLI